MSKRLIHKLSLIAALCAISATGLVAAVTASAHSTPARAATHARPAAKSKTFVVKLKNYMFNPANITIQVGDTIKWEWLDGPAGSHNITPLKKKGSLLFRGTGDHTSGSYSVKFTKKGTYYYECSNHPASMQGKIIVK